MFMKWDTCHKSNKFQTIRKNEISNLSNVFLNIMLMTSQHYFVDMLVKLEKLITMIQIIFPCHLKDNKRTAHLNNTIEASCKLLLYW